MRKRPDPAPGHLPRQQDIAVPDPKDDSRYQETGFPSLQWEDDDLPTRPLPLHESFITCSPNSAAAPPRNP